MPSTEMEDLVSSLREDIAEIKALLNSMQKEILGNGQPGRIQRIESRLEPLEVMANQLRGWVRGAMWVAGAALTIAGIALGKFFLR
jgi:hypothetical protein